MSNKNLNSLTSLGQATQLVNDFKFVKREYFALKHEHLALIKSDSESVDDDYWEDKNFEAECKVFERRKKKYDEAQQLYKALKSTLEK